MPIRKSFKFLISCVFRDEKVAIMREKHSALMKPVVFALDHVRSITAASAETPHEAWFQETYGETIHNALERLRNPLNPANPASSWVPFKQVKTAVCISVLRKCCYAFCAFYLCVILPCPFTDHAELAAKGTKTG